jgi:hypothetical protein
MELTSAVLASVFIAIHEYLHSKAFLYRSHESTEIVLFFREFEEALTFLAVLPPFSTVKHASGCVQVDSPAALNSVCPLSIVDVAVCLLEDSTAVALA